MTRLAALLVFGCLACQHAPEPAPAPKRNAPTARAVTFVRYAIEQPSLDRAVMLLVWRAENPQAEPVTFSRWSLEVQLAGKTVPGPLPDPSITVPPNSSALVELRVPLDYLALFGDNRPWDKGFLARVAPLVGEKEIKASAGGEHQVPRYPSLSLGNFHVERGGPAFDVDLVVVLSNPNDFALKVDRLDAEVLFAGDRFGRVQLGELTLQPLEKKELPFKQSRSKLSLGGLSRAALQSTEAVSTDVKAEAQIGGRALPITTGKMIYAR